MNITYEVLLLNYLRDINVQMFSEIKTEGAIVGYNCSATSLIRKTSILDRVKLFITTHKLPLQVIDTQEMGCHFEIKKATTSPVALQS